MPAAKPAEFRRRVVILARAKDKPVAQIAKDLGISESCLRRWMDRADVEAGRKDGLTGIEREELVRLRRELRVARMEVEILKRASAYGHRLSQAGLLGSMGRVASSVDNTMIESFWSTMQRELLDRREWATQAELGTAIFDWIEGWYNPTRRHSGIGYQSPATFEAEHTALNQAA